MKWNIYQKGPETASNTQYFARVPAMHPTADLKTLDLKPLVEIEVPAAKELEVLEFINTYRGPEGVFRQRLTKILEEAEGSDKN